jgi:predicted nuclease of predicted toxin-antitoxin system
LKKRSVARPRKPLEGFTFLVEVSLGSSVAVGLLEHGLTVVQHSDVLPANATDPEWAAVAGQPGWVVLTKDGELQRKPNEVEAIRIARLRVFTLARGNLRTDEMVAAYVAALPRIARLLKKLPPPYIVRITRTGLVSAVRQL